MQVPGIKLMSVPNIKMNAVVKYNHIKQVPIMKKNELVLNIKMNADSKY